MPNDMNLLRVLTEEARARLPEGAYLKRDRGDALLITDFDGEIEGFARIPRGKFTALLPTPERILRYESEFSAPAGTFSASLLRFRGQTADEDNVLLFTRGVKLLNGAAAELTAFDRAVRQTAAAALRTGNGGGVYALALLRDELESTVFQKPRQ